jgi:hypothetical protein
MKEIYIFGRSKKIIDAVRYLYPKDKITIIPWRIDALPFINLLEGHLLVICGFDHSQYGKGFKNFYLHNIENPFRLVLKIEKLFKHIAYINTNYTEEQNYTFSYYLYAKNELCRRLVSVRSDIKVIKLPSIVNSHKFPVMHASLLEKILGYILIRVKKINILDISEIGKYIKYNENKYHNINTVVLHFKNIKRTRFIDKVCRVILA